jgi:RNA polymerase sigma-32 factor
LSPPPKKSSRTGRRDSTRDTAGTTAGSRPHTSNSSDIDDDEESSQVEVLDPELEPEFESVTGADFSDGDDDDAPTEVVGEPVPAVVSAAGDSTALVRSDPLSLYLAEIRHYPILSREEEHELAVRYVEEGDADAAIKLVTANLRLVVMVAREYQRAFHNLLDLIQEGNVGLLEAVKQFDPYRGVRFPSYAVWWIRAYVIRYVMNNFRLVKLGTTQAQRRLFFNLKKEKARLEAEGFSPTAERVAESLGVKPREVLEMDQRMSAGSEVSANLPVGEDGSATMMDLLPGANDTAEEEVAEGEFYALMREKLEEFGAGLQGREAEIFRERLVAEEPLTLQELGERYGVSRERVRQMEAALKKRLREWLVEQVRGIEEVSL